ncbi:hypothetical protein [Enterovibrio norvegicus]|uniref:hypothetical protein n=1 Tax=Enterovibrio norvegicus TaxID=188144 RepID=UPI000305C491|nr:hypothetical protein [Enterovibrio norvegicus]
MIDSKANNATSPLARFVRNASVGDKSKVYKRVIVAATESQNKTIQKAHSVQG